MTYTKRWTCPSRGCQVAYDRRSLLTRHLNRDHNLMLDETKTNQLFRPSSLRPTKPKDKDDRAKDKTRERYRNMGSGSRFGRKRREREEEEKREEAEIWDIIDIRSPSPVASPCSSPSPSLAPFLAPSPCPSPRPSPLTRPSPFPSTFPRRIGDRPRNINYVAALSPDTPEPAFPPSPISPSLPAPLPQILSSDSIDPFLQIQSSDLIDPVFFASSINGLEREKASLIDDEGRDDVYDPRDDDFGSVLKRKGPTWVTRTPSPCPTRSTAQDISPISTISASLDFGLSDQGVMAVEEEEEDQLISYDEDMDVSTLPEPIYREQSNPIRRQTSYAKDDRAISQSAIPTFGCDKISTQVVSSRVPQREEDYWADEEMVSEGEASDAVSLSSRASTVSRGDGGFGFKEKPYGYRLPASGVGVGISG